LFSAIQIAGIRILILETEKIKEEKKHFKKWTKQVNQKTNV